MSSFRSRLAGVWRDGCWESSGDQGREVLVVSAAAPRSKGSVVPQHIQLSVCTSHLHSPRPPIHPILSLSLAVAAGLHPALGGSPRCTCTRPGPALAPLTLRSLVSAVCLCVQCAVEAPAVTQPTVTASAVTLLCSASRPRSASDSPIDCKAAAAIRPHAQLCS